jgi:hypothetical protein
MIRNDTSCYVTPIQNWEVGLGMTTTRPACPPRIPTEQLMQSINASSQYTYIHLYSSTLDCDGMFQNTLILENVIGHTTAL